jgi:hypothetical protein
MLLEHFIYLAEKLCKFLVIEDVKTTTGRNFTDCCWVKTMAIVAVTALNEYTAVTETFSKYFTANVI